MHRLTASLLLLACALAPSASGQAESLPSDTVAVVGDAIVYADAFERSLAIRLTRTGEADTPGLRRAQLDDLIDAYLLADHAERTGFDTPELAFRLDLDRRTLARDAYFERHLIGMLGEPTDADLRRAYARTKQEVVARQLAFATQAEAQAAYERLESGTPFLILAQAVTGASGDSLAGWIGPVRYFGNADPHLTEALFELAEGEHSTPTRSRAGWHLLYAERWIVSPVLAEDQYQQRRASVAGQLRERRRIVAGDAFVQRVMTDLDVQVDASAVAALNALLNSPPEPAAVRISTGEQFEPSDAQALRDATQPGAVLATYGPPGSRTPLTMGEYAAWLPDLPAGEARARTAASVGRALRNIVLAERGTAGALLDSDAARARLAHAARLHRARALRAALRDTSQTAPPDALLRDLAEQRGLLGRTDLRADYAWAIHPTRPEAEAARTALLSGMADVQVGRDVSVPTIPLLRTHLASIPIGEPVVVGLHDGTWALLRVDRRTEVQPSFDELRPRLAAALAPYAAEVRLLSLLRSQARIEVRDDVLERLATLSLSF